MPAPTPHQVSGTPPNLPGPPIAEIQILVYSWDRGKSEVRVRFPDEAQPGAPQAAANQARLRQLAAAELNDAFKIFEDAAAHD